MTMDISGICIYRFVRIIFKWNVVLHIPHAHRLLAYIKSKNEKLNQFRKKRHFASNTLSFFCDEYLSMQAKLYVEFDITHICFDDRPNFS